MKKEKKLSEEQLKEFIISLLQHGGDCDYWMCVKDKMGKPISDKVAPFLISLGYEYPSSFCTEECPFHIKPVSPTSEAQYIQLTCEAAKEYWLEHYPGEEDILLECLL